MSRKNEAITISCTPEQKTSLEALAKDYGIMWGDRPNISALIKAIADGDILLSEATEEQKIKAEITRLQEKLKQS